MPTHIALELPKTIRLDLCPAEVRALQIVLDHAADHFTGGYALLLRDHLETLRETLTRALRS